MIQNIQSASIGRVIVAVGFLTASIGCTSLVFLLDSQRSMLLIAGVCIVFVGIVMALVKRQMMLVPQSSAGFTVVFISNFKPLRSLCSQSFDLLFLLLNVFGMLICLLILGIEVIALVKLYYAHGKPKSE